MKKIKILKPVLILSILAIGVLASCSKTHHEKMIATRDLYLGIKYDKTETALNAIENGAFINFKPKSGETALMLACKKGRELVVKSLIEHKADVNFEQSDGFTALMYAAVNNRVEILHFLIKAGAKVDSQLKKYKSTALMFASENGYVDVVKILLKNKANVFLRDAIGRNAFNIAKAKGNKYIARLILLNAMDNSKK